MATHMSKHVFCAMILCLPAGCSRPPSDPNTVKANLDAAAKIPPNPLTVDVKGVDREVVFGVPIPLDITVRNSSQRVIWFDEKALPWRWFPAYEIQVDSPFLTTG